MVYQRKVGKIIVKGKFKFSRPLSSKESSELVAFSSSWVPDKRGENLLPAICPRNPIFGLYRNMYRLKRWGVLLSGECILEDTTRGDVLVITDSKVVHTKFAPEILIPRGPGFYFPHHYYSVPFPLDTGLCWDVPLPLVLDTESTLDLTWAGKHLRNYCTADVDSTSAIANSVAPFIGVGGVGSRKSGQARKNK